MLVRTVPGNIRESLIARLQLADDGNKALRAFLELGQGSLPSQTVLVSQKGYGAVKYKLHTRNHTKNHIGNAAGLRAAAREYFRKHTEYEHTEFFLDTTISVIHTYININGRKWPAM